MDETPEGSMNGPVGH